MIEAIGEEHPQQLKDKAVVIRRVCMVGWGGGGRIWWSSLSWCGWCGCVGMVGWGWGGVSFDGHDHDHGHGVEWVCMGGGDAMVRVWEVYVCGGRMGAA